MSGYLKPDEPTVDVTCDGCGDMFTIYRRAVEEGQETLCFACLRCGKGGRVPSAPGQRMEMREKKRVVSGGRRYGKMLEQLETMILAVRTGQTALLMSPEFVIMTKTHYDELMTKIYPRKQPQMWIDEESKMIEDTTD